MIYPQLAQQTEVTSLQRFIEDDTWVMEQKLDGHRVLLMSPGGDFPPTAITRNGTMYTRKLPQAIQDYRFPEGEWVLDGELVGDTFWVFDMPKHPPFDFVIDAVTELVAQAPVPLFVRRDVLEAFVASHANPFRLVPQARTPDEKIRLAEVSLAKNYEGLVLKKVDAPYRSGGRTPEWLKVKYVATADCVVLGVRDDGKESVRLGMYGPSFRSAGIATRDLVMHDVGRASLIGKEKNGTIQVGDVIEVRYLYAGANGRLYQPTILRKRTDKHAVECTTDQMKLVNKAVLEQL